MWVIGAAPQAGSLERRLKLHVAECGVERDQPESRRQAGDIGRSR